MDVIVIEKLVGEHKRLSGELIALKAEIQAHEDAIGALDAKGQPVFKELQSVGRELRVALGLVSAEQEQG